MGCISCLAAAPHRRPPAVCALLPLFNEKSATPAMIKHGMDVQQKSIDLWIAFGVGKNFKFYSINSICATIGEPRSQALLM